MSHSGIFNTSKYAITVAVLKTNDKLPIIFRTSAIFHSKIKTFLLISHLLKKQNKTVLMATLYILSQFELFLFCFVLQNLDESTNNFNKVLE